MRAAFLDTSGWLAALSPRKVHHVEAKAQYQAWIEAKTRLVTSNLVVAEMQILIGRGRGGVAALRFLESVYADPLHQIVFVDRDLERSAIDRWLRRFSDHPISLTDAVSFEIMRTNGLDTALALDFHFEMAGFRARPE